MEMKSWHRELAHLHAYTALTVQELADKLGKARNTVYRALRMPEVAELTAQLREQKEQEIAHDGTERVNRLIDKAWSALEEVLDAEGGAQQKVTAALGVLKGTGQLVERTEQDVRQLVGVIPVPARVDPDEWDKYLEEKRRELEAEGNPLEPNGPGGV